jgi:hypothetical protein
MARKRVIYQSEALYAGQVNATGYHYSSGNSGVNQIAQLHRVQSANYSFNVTRQDVNQYGQLAAIDRVILQAPTVNLDFNYYLTNGVNEKRLGLTIDGVTSAISGLLDGTTDTKNYFISTSPEGTDNIGYNAVAREVIAIGNGFLSNYSVDAAVGGLPTASVTVEALNIKVDPTASGNAIPAVDPETGATFDSILYQLPQATTGVAGQVAALRPGDITIDVQAAFGAKVAGVGKANFQSIRLQAPLARQALERLGSKFAFSREIQYPLTVSLNATANVTDLVAGNLADLICNDQDYNLVITLREPACSGAQGPVAMQYTLKGAKLDSQAFTSSIGANKSVDLTWSAQIGGPQDTSHGLFISGSYAGS